MKQLTKNISLLQLTLALAMLLFSFGQTLAQTQIIGVSLPLSGNAAPLGKQFVAGIRLAMEVIPEASNIELIISDDGCDQELAKLAIEDLLEVGSVLVTGFICNAPVFTAADMLRDEAVPILVAGARSNRILKDRARYSWNIWQMSPQDADGSQSAFDLLVERWRNVPYAIVDDGTVFGRTQADEFRALMEEAGNKPQFVDNFRPTQSTQAGLIRRLTKAGVEAVYLAANGDDVALIGRDILKYKAKLEIATGDGVSLLPYIENNTGIPIGLLAVMAPPPEEITAVVKLLEKIDAAKLEPEPYLLLGYATGQVIVDYLGKNENEFSGRQFQTILGNVEFNAVGKNITKHYFLYRWDGENFNRVE